MPKPPRPEEANAPRVPPVSTATWRHLLAAADAFQQLAPWEWMHDSHVVGLRHPNTREVLLGSILGRLLSLFALTVYRGRAGHQWLLNTILDAGCEEDAEGLERGFAQDLIKVEFDPADQELSAGDPDWHPMLPPPEAPPEPVRLPENVVARLARLPFASRCALEVNVAYAPLPVAAPERPFLPKGAMVVDRASGMVGSVLFGPAENRDGAGVLATVLEGALVKYGLRPETLVVRHLGPVPVPR